MSKTSDLAKNRKIRRKQRKAAKKKALKDFAKSLCDNLPKSEQWFLDQLSERNIRVELKSNVPIFGYIPDFINKEYKFVIEVDGSIHNLPEIKAKDKKKDAAYKRAKYKVFRVVAYDKQSLDKAVSGMLAHIKKHHSEVKQKRKIKAKKDYWRRVRKGIDKQSEKSKIKHTTCTSCKQDAALTEVTYGNRTYRVCSQCKPKVLRAKQITNK